MTAATAFRHALAERDAAACLPVACSRRATREARCLGVAPAGRMLAQPAGRQSPRAPRS